MLFLLVLVALAGCGSGGAGSSLVEGRFFPSFLLRDLHATEAEPVPLGAFRGRLVVLNVWATWCPPCRRELPSLERLQDRLDSSRFAVLGLSVDEDADFAREYLLERGITFRNFIDLGGRDAQRLLGIRAYPMTFVISPEGVLLRSVAGERAWDSVEVVDALDAAREGDLVRLQTL